MEINIPRRPRNSAAAEEAPGPEGEAPMPGGRAGVGRGRASREFAIASRIFHGRNYPAALRRINRYLDRDAGDQDLLQLRSLTNFALGDYRAAYRDALAAVAAGEAWNWMTVRSLYRSAGDYSAQYRALEDYVAANPGSPEPAFLFAYHNLMIGNQEAAHREFARVAGMDPANETARRLAAGERPPQPRAKAAVPGARLKSDAVKTSPLSPPQEQIGSGPSVDFGQPASPTQAAPQGQK